MANDYPELIESKDEIGRAVVSGESTEQICDDLRRRGVRTTTERLNRFCASFEKDDELRAETGFDASATVPADRMFPELAPARKYVRQWMEQGMTADMIWTCIGGLLKINTTRSRVRAYVPQLYDELYPPGPIKSDLFQIKAPDRVWRDDEPIFAFGDEPNEDVWTHADVYQGTVIFGAPGSGKTSGSGRLVAQNFLAAGFGGLVMTAKKGEAENWIKLCTDMRRGNDIAVVKCDGLLRLNFLQYEAEAPGQGSEMTSNLVAFFQNLFSVMSAGQNRRSEEDFWKHAGQQLLTNLLETFKMAGEPLTLDGLCEFITRAPMDLEEVEGWEERPFFGTCLRNAEASVFSPADKRIWAKLKDYWLHIYPDLAPNTRSCVTTGFTAMAEILRGRHIYELVSTRTTCTPEMIMSGKIVILDLSAAEFREAGVLVQGAWKYLLQRALLRRTDEGDQRRPVFIWEDEAQNFLIDHDNEFQAICREYRVARVLISQNLNNFYAKFGGGDFAKVKVDSLIANINTRIFHANGDMVTNKWASEYLGTEMKTIQEISTTPRQYSGSNPVMGWLYERAKKPIVTRSSKTTREALVQPHEFQALQVGSSANGWVTSAIITQVGRRFSDTGRSFALVAFQQTKIPEIKFTQELMDETSTRLKNE